MKRLFCTSLSAALLLSACSRPSNEVAEVDAEIRGEPIAPSPLQAQAPAPELPSSVAEAPAAAPSAPALAGRAPEPVIAEPKAPEALEEAPGINGFASVTFDRLASFEFVMPDDMLATTTASGAPSAEQIPPAIRNLDQTRVALKGFMLPLKVERGLVTELLLMRDQSMCCFGTVPKINEWVSVKMTNGVKALMDQPVTVLGKLHVGEMRENGYLVGIYRMDGEGLVDALDF
jgi:hypothetical protein